MISTINHRLIEYSIDLNWKNQLFLLKKSMIVILSMIKQHLNTKWWITNDNWIDLIDLNLLQKPGRQQPDQSAERRFRRIHQFEDSVSTIHPSSIYLSIK